ncbi:MAG: ferredoxin-type protein NapF [Azoarcus sp.]|jgi:ferredoxin-type protein NapF|nr:ferredoxin-type protein NapF [Azoarcus sp.]
MGRRVFLRGQHPRKAAAPYRPPWSVDEAVFTRTCTRCGACVAACPTGLLSSGAGGFPEADFRRSHCTFCADCAHACSENTRQSASGQQAPISFSPELPPWALQPVIGAECLPHRGILCRSCEEHCEPGAIRFSPRPNQPARPDVLKASCTTCGECVASCPAFAISMQPFSLPDPQANFSMEKQPQ